MPTIDGYYLTRSPDSNRTDFVNYIKYDGWLLSRYIHAEQKGYRPAIIIKIS